MNFHDAEPMGRHLNKKSLLQFYPQNIWISGSAYDQNDVVF